jgi:replication factor A1
MEMRNKIGVAEYLYFLSAKYEVDFDRLFEALGRAREKSEVTLGKLLVECRRRGIAYDVFLITCDERVVAQFYVPKQFLDQPNHFGKPTCRYLLRKVSTPSVLKGPRCIRDLRFGMKRVTIKARVLEVPKASLVYTRFGEYARVTHALIGDETGAIKLCLWNERVNVVSVDTVVSIENASVTKYRGETQLRLGRNAKLSVIESRGFPSVREIEKRRLLKIAA